LRVVSSFWMHRSVTKVSCIAPHIPEARYFSHSLGKNPYIVTIFTGQVCWQPLLWPMYMPAITGYGCPCFLLFIIFPKAYAMKEIYDQVRLTWSALLVQIMNWCDPLHIKGNPLPNSSITGIDTHLLHMNNRSNIQTLRVSEATKYIHYDFNLQLLCDKMSCKLEFDACVWRGIGWVYTQKTPSLWSYFSYNYSIVRIWV
jgi:hypothetical protein